MTQQEYDSPWKEVIENYFRECLEFFFPLAAEGINWQRGYNFLDLEASSNPFATVAMAHLKAKATRQDDAARQQWKLYLTKRLYE